MRRPLMFALTVLLGFGLVGCGGGIKEGTPPNADPAARPEGFEALQKDIGKNMQNPPPEKPGQPR